MRTNCTGFLAGCCLALLFFTPAAADTFTVLNEEGQREKIEAELIGSNQGMHVLSLADGSLKYVPQRAVLERKPSSGPTPLTGQQMLDQLSERFGEELVRGEVDAPYVIALVLSAPLDKSDELRVRALLKKAASFMQNVEGMFTAFTKRMRIPANDPKYPLVLVIFETDEDFEKYATEATGGNGLSSGNIAGFYSSNTNWLAVRLSECQTFEVPLHEAIHQQVYNREIFKRLAPIPVWFNEGIATGFEGEGDRIKINPTKISTHFARKAMEGTRINWEQVILEDAAFRGDVLAGDAYTHAWSLHWLLVTNYETQYTEYVKHLAQYEPLQQVTPEDRSELFHKVFGKTISEIQKEFPTALQAGIRKQRILFKEEKQPGFSFTQSQLGEVELTAVSQNGVLRLNGKLRNVSPIRDMDFYVIVVTSTGSYADWYIPGAKMRQVVPLNQQIVQKVLPGAPGGPAQTFRVFLRSAVPGTEPAQRWSSGNYPLPMVGQ